MKMINKKIDHNLVLVVLVFIFGVFLTLPLLDKIPNHGDESHFFDNAFRIMSGKTLQNYFHVALTEYMLAGFLTIMNLFTNFGVNFPGNPSAVTYYYGRLFCFVLYILGFIFGALALQRNEKKVRLRVVIFSMLYFSSIGIFERFLRVTSDAMLIIIYFNFVILSQYFLSKKPAIWFAFILNTLFIFLGSFTNIKSLFLILPLVVMNTIVVFKKRQNSLQIVHNSLNKVYVLILYTAGMLFVVLALWTVLIPKPFNYELFWKDTRVNVAYSARTDISAPLQSHGSWKFYLYDTFVEYIGLPTVLAFIILLVLYLKLVFRGSWQFFLSEIKKRWLDILGNPYDFPWFIFLLGLISYYFGISSVVVHWSRWGIPLGILFMLLLSVAVEKLASSVWPILRGKNMRLTLLVGLLILVWGLRFLLVADLIRMDYDPFERERLTRMDVESFLSEKGIALENQKQKAAWTPSSYTKNFRFVAFDELKDDENKDLEYILFVPWHLPTLYGSKGVNLSVHNQQAVLQKIAERVTFRFPTFLSYYSFATRYFSWNILKVTGIPEMYLLVEPAYGVVKLKKPLPEMRFIYSLGFDELAHYYSPYSRIFNFKNLPNGKYSFPPCYGHSETKYIKTGETVLPPSELGGVGGQTAGFYCHSIRFGYLFKGKYKIKLDGLPETDEESGMVYADRPFRWYAQERIIEFEVWERGVSVEVGIATKEKTLDDLSATIGYVL